MGRTTRKRISITLGKLTHTLTCLMKLRKIVSDIECDSFSKHGNVMHMPEAMPIVYVSEKLKGSVLNYPYDKKLYMLVTTFKLWRHYFWEHMQKERLPAQGNSKLLPRGGGLFQVLECISDNAYKLNLPC